MRRESRHRPGRHRTDTPVPRVDDAPPGPRRARLEEKRKQRRRHRFTASAVVALLALVAAGIGLGRTGDENGSSAGEPAAAVSSEGEDRIITTLLVGTREGAPQRGAVWMTMLSLDTESGTGSVVYIPAHTATEVPGRGLMAVGESLASGGVPLLLLSTRVLLGIPVDRYIELSDADARVLFETLGAISVDVPAEVRVPAGPDHARLLFTEGPQRLDPPFLAQLLYIRGLDGDDVELGSRHLAFWAGVFQAVEDDPERLAEAVRRAGAALAESDARIDQHAAFFEALASLEPGDRTLASLPVGQLSVGGSELYETDSEELTAFVAETIGSEPLADEEIEVQILNGNGVPGIGEKVARRLGSGFRVILSGNAPRLNYPRTLVIVYDSSAEAQALAQRARERLGLGEVQISAQSQGIVDVTIVVGKDFLRTL